MPKREWPVIGSRFKKRWYAYHTGRRGAVWELVSLSQKWVRGNFVVEETWECIAEPLIRRVRKLRKAQRLKAHKNRRKLLQSRKVIARVREA